MHHLLFCCFLSAVAVIAVWYPPFLVPGGVLRTKQSLCVGSGKCSSHFSIAGTCTHFAAFATWGMGCLPGSSRRSSIHQSPANVTNAVFQVAVCDESLHISQFEEFLSALSINN